MPRQFLTESLIQQLVCPSARAHVEIFDTRMRGLYVDVLKSDRRMYRVRYRECSRYRILTLGDTQLLTLDEARQQARTAQRCAMQGGDPKQVMVTSWHEGLRLTNFFLDHYLSYIRSYKRSWQTDVFLYNRHLDPLWGERAMETITPQEIAALVRSLLSRGYAPATCNRLLAVLRYLYTLAARWELIDPRCQPARTVKDLKEDNRIERYLSREEAHRLLAAARTSLNAQLADLVGLLLYTGARRSEALQARWCDVDRHQRLWRIPRSKSGKVRHIPLSSAAMLLLSRRFAARSVHEPAQGFIFANPATKRPYTAFSASWKTTCRRAGLTGLRIHDLRHSFASFLVNAGHSLYEVQALLGHANSRTTARYAHLSRERLFDAVEAIPVIESRDAARSEAAFGAEGAQTPESGVQ